MINYDEPLEPIKRKQTKTHSKQAKTPPVTLEQALEIIKKLGLSITIPTSNEEIEKQQLSLSRLGFTEPGEAKPKKGRRISVEPLCTGVLYTQHIIGGIKYGPGSIQLDDPVLFQSLMKQDQLCVQAYMDTAQYTTHSRCFVLAPGSGRDPLHKWSKREVSESLFSNTSLDESQPSLSVGAMDIAGYNPSFNQGQRRF